MLPILDLKKTSPVNSMKKKTVDLIQLSLSQTTEDPEPTVQADDSDDSDEDIPLARRVERFVQRIGSDN